jgi:hypothetical protein
LPTATPGASDPTSLAPEGSAYSSAASAPIALATPALVAGWASQTHFRDADTQIRVRVRDLFKNIPVPAASSGRSILGSPYQTDVEPGAVSLMKAALLHKNWSLRGQKPESASVILSQMVAALNGEWSPESNTIANRIISQSNWFVRSKSFPSSSQDLLDLIGSNPMCREFVDRGVLTAGGQPRRYVDSATFLGNTDTSSWRPGMAFYQITEGSSTLSHAAVILDINWSANGQIVEITVVEANWKKEYKRPGSSGGLPWARPISRRNISLTDIRRAGGVAVNVG